MIKRILNGSMLPVTVFFLFLALVLVILHSVYQDRVLGNLPEIYEKRAESRIAFECADVADEGIAYCRNEVSELEARRLQEHLGLYTQQSIAASTFGMLLASVSAVFLTLIGVYLLRETLRQTVAANEAAQEAVRVTREMGEAQVRAYLSVKSASYIVYPSRTIIIEIEMKNGGQSPATNIAVNNFVLSVKNLATEAFHSLRPQAPFFFTDLSSGETATIRCNQDIENTHNLKGTTISFVADIHYRTVFDESDRVYRIMASAPQTSFPISIGEKFPMIVVPMGTEAKEKD